MDFIDDEVFLGPGFGETWIKKVTLKIEK